jgi:hypothetical protein
MLESPQENRVPKHAITNYEEMQTIFSSGLATDKFAMGSCELLGSLAPSLSPEDADTHESSTVILDGPDKPAYASDKIPLGNMKLGAFTDDKIITFTHIT